MPRAEPRRARLGSSFALNLCLYTRRLDANVTAVDWFRGRTARIEKAGLRRSEARTMRQCLASRASGAIRAFTPVFDGLWRNETRDPAQKSAKRLMGRDVSCGRAFLRWAPDRRSLRSLVWGTSQCSTPLLRVKHRKLRRLARHVELRPARGDAIVGGAPQ